MKVQVRFGFRVGEVINGYVEGSPHKDSATMCVCVCVSCLQQNSCSCRTAVAPPDGGVDGLPQPVEGATLLCSCWTFSLIRNAVNPRQD